MFITNYELSRYYARRFIQLPLQHNPALQSRATCIGALPFAKAQLVSNIGWHITERWKDDREFGSYFYRPGTTQVVIESEPRLWYPLINSAKADAAKVGVLDHVGKCRRIECRPILRVKGESFSFLVEM